MKFGGDLANNHTAFRGVPRTLGTASILLASVIAVSGGVLAFTGGVASAGSATSFTWSGADSASSGTTGWSDPANWVGGVAPAPSSSADLTFPMLSCSETCGNESDNNVTGLKVPDLSVALGEETGNGDYSLSGNSIKIGTIDVTSSVPNGQSGQNLNLSMPMKLSGSESWSIDIENNSNLGFGTITAATSDTLAVALPVTAGNGAGFAYFPSINTGPITFTGTNGGSEVTGADFNGTTDQPVTIKSTGTFITGPGGTTKQTTTTDFGPLTLSGTSAQFGNGGGGGPYGIDEVEGAASISKSTISLISLEPGTGSKPTAGVDYPQLAATGAVKLGSGVILNLFAACNQTVGTKYTIVTGSSVTGTFKGIANDDVVQANPDGSTSCQSGTAPYFEVKYTGTTVTATVTTQPSDASRVTPHSVSSRIVRELSDGKFEFIR